MSLCTPALWRRFAWLVASLLVGAIVVPQFADGGFCGFRNRGVGGIAIDPSGVVSKPTSEDKADLLAHLRREIKGAPDELAAPTEMRKVSLKRLEAAARAGHGRLPEEVQYLGGLQRIQYVFIYPEENDIVLAGPGEGWKVDGEGNVVGITTGRPVLHFEDLLVALRSAGAARDEGITCSIDPSEEGRENLARYLRSVRTFTPEVKQGIERALGPQQITLTGVPQESHFARIMVASDFYLKQYAMGLEKPPVDGMPSYLDLLSSPRGANVSPRWWLAVNYEPLAKSKDGLAWELRGPGVKCMTEDELFEDGKVSGTGRTSPAAQKWADTFTEKYDEVSAENPTFGELRNLMDMAVVAALLKKEKLTDKAGCPLPHLMGEQDDLAIHPWTVPQTIGTMVSYKKAGREYIITASGGVDIESWAVLDGAQESEQVESLRSKATPTGQSWYWN